WPNIQHTAGRCVSGPYDPNAILPQNQNHCNWSPLDNLIGTLAAHGLAVQPTVFGSAKFVSGAASDPAVPPRTPNDLQAWQQFLAAAADRYGPYGDFWAQGGPFLTDHPGAKVLPVK